MILGEELRTVAELVKLCITLDRIDKKLQISYNICQIFENMDTNEEMKKETKEMSKFSQNLLMNAEFRKAVFKRTALMDREPVTYFGDEILKGDQYDYDENLEKDLTVIDFRITTFLGNIMRFVQSATGI